MQCADQEQQMQQQHRRESGLVKEQGTVLAAAAWVCFW